MAFVIGIGLGCGTGADGGGAPAVPHVSGFGAIGEFPIGGNPVGSGYTLDASTPIADYADSVLWQPGTSPASNPPNSYTKGDLYRNVTVSVGIGVTSLQVAGVPYNNGQLNSAPTTIGVYIDDVYSQDLTYSGTLGVRDTQTLTLDGAAHLIRFEEQAALVNIIGSFSYVAPTTPNTRVVCVGDSITARYLASVASKGYFSTLRAAMNPATYGVTNWGQTGRTAFGSSTIGPAIASRCDGSSKNIVVLYLIVNDFNTGVTLVNYQNALRSIIQGAHGVNSAIKFLLVNMPPSANAGGGGGTPAQYTAQQTAIAGGLEPNCTTLDLSTVYPGGTPWSTYTSDGTHPTDAGHALIAAAIQTAVQAL